MLLKKYRRKCTTIYLKGKSMGFEKYFIINKKTEPTIWLALCGRTRLRLWNLELNLYTILDVNLTML